MSDNSLNKTKRVWKATGKLFADIGYQWRPTGKKFTLEKLNCGYQWRPTGKKFALGEMCPLTMFCEMFTLFANQPGPHKNWGSNSKLSTLDYFQMQVVQVILWYLDSGCSKHMTGNRSKLKNFVEKFIGTVRFRNDHFGAIMGYGDYVIGDSVISRVYYVEGLGHNLFSVGQFCDSDLEVAFRKHTCFVRDINGADLLKGSRSTNLYTISIDDMMKSSPICLLSKASKSKSWLWHRRLNHLNFGTINDLARQDLVRGVGVFHQKYVPRTPQQNGVVERQNRTLVEAACTMMIFSKAPCVSMVEDVANALFGALCYPTNDSEDLGIFQASLTLDFCWGSPPTDKELEMLFQPMFDEYLEQSRVNEPVPSATAVNAQVVPPGTSLSTTIAQDAPSTSASSSTSDMHHPV
ncbi:integrase, catalytic region, zinc finger, CCHC-type containing protein [Tanacetum coccineum]